MPREHLQHSISARPSLSRVRSSEVHSDDHFADSTVAVVRKCATLDPKHDDVTREWGGDTPGDWEAPQGEDRAMATRAGTRTSRSSVLLDPDLLSVSVLHSTHRAGPRVAIRARIPRTARPRLSPHKYPPGYSPATITSS